MFMIVRIKGKTPLVTECGGLSPANLFVWRRICGLCSAGSPDPALSILSFGKYSMGEE